MEIHPLIDPFAIHFSTFAGDVYTLDTASITLTAGTLTAAAGVFAALTLDFASHDYIFSENTEGVPKLALQHQSEDVPFRFGLYTKNGDMEDNISFNIFGLGTPGSMTNTENVNIGWSTTGDGQYQIKTNQTGGGEVRPLWIGVENHEGIFELQIDGTITTSESNFDMSSDPIFMGTGSKMTGETANGAGAPTVFILENTQTAGATEFVELQFRQGGFLRGKIRSKRTGAWASPPTRNAFLQFFTGNNIGTVTGLALQLMEDQDAEFKEDVSLLDNKVLTLGTTFTDMQISSDGTNGIIDVATQLRLGNITTTYMAIEADADTYWVGDGTGLPYGHMYVDGTQVIRVALTLNTPAEVEGDGTGGTAAAEDGWLAGDLNLMTFPTGGTEHHVTITKAGIYHITWNLSFKMVTGAANTQIHAGLAIDSTTFRRDRCEAHRTISNNSDTGNMSGSCMIDLPNGNEELSLWMENTTNSNDADVSHGSLTVVMVGGT